MFIIYSLSAALNQSLVQPATSSPWLERPFCPAPPSSCSSSLPSLFTWLFSSPTKALFLPAVSVISWFLLSSWQYLHRTSEVLSWIVYQLAPSWLGVLILMTYWLRRSKLSEVKWENARKRRSLRYWQGYLSCFPSTWSKNMNLCSLRALC